MKLSNLVKNNTIQELLINNNDSNKLSKFIKFKEQNILSKNNNRTIFNLNNNYKSRIRPIVATGGEIEDITIDGKLYRIHAFKQVGQDSFNVERIGNITNKIDCLVIGGGGAGGSNGGGGGGAGGYNYFEYSVSDNTYEIIVGAGGKANTHRNGTRYNGGDGDMSSAFNVVSYGGGGGSASGAKVSTRRGRNGASGGGGSGYEGCGSGGYGISGQGHNGASGVCSGKRWRDGGGGGAGSPGYKSLSYNVGGMGGDGIANSITGQLTFYASGGSGYQQHDSTPGGGGASRQSGQINTGGGGGSYSDGGSGIVLIRYRI
ncbi:MAG: glycine-rich domain-containing protein [bacterium]